MSFMAQYTWIYLCMYIYLYIYVFKVFSIYSEMVSLKIGYILFRKILTNIHYRHERLDSKYGWLYVSNCVSYKSTIPIYQPMLAINAIQSILLSIHVSNDISNVLTSYLKKGCQLKFSDISPYSPACYL